MNPFKLKLEAETLLLAFRKQGYQCRKQHRQLAYKLLKEDRGVYVLTYIPEPVASWSVIPNDSSPMHQELTQLVKSALDSLATIVKPSPSCKEDYSRPWAIVRLLPNAQRYTIARFFNRQDAHDHRNFLARYMPAAEFEIVFDSPTNSEKLSVNID